MTTDDQKAQECVAAFKPLFDAAVSVKRSATNPRNSYPDLSDADYASWMEGEEHFDRLRRAAPEMLEALEAVRDRLDYLRGLWGDEGITRRLADQVREAIAKAKGE